MINCIVQQKAKELLLDQECLEQISALRVGAACAQCIITLSVVLSFRHDGRGEESRGASRSLLEEPDEEVHIQISLPAYFAECTCCTAFVLYRLISY